MEIDLRQLEDDFIRRLKFIDFDSLSQEAKIRLATELDFFAELQASGLSRVYETLQGDYADIVSQLLKSRPDFINPFMYEDLQIIADLDGSQLLRSGEAYSDYFKRKLISGFIRGENTNTILNDLSIPSFRWNWNIAAIDTARSEFQVTALAKLYEDEPEQRFKLYGALDAKTRCECRAVLEHQPEEGWTKAQIDNGAATKIVKQHCPKVKPESQVYSWSFRGGFNCRHVWETA